MSQSIARRAAMAVLVLGGVALGGLLTRSGGSTAEPSPELSSEQALRIVSLSPGVSETLVALNGSDRVVGQSDYGPLADDIPRVGSALTPELEAIARLEPDLIVGTEIRGDQKERLSGIARTEYLPWLSVQDVASSIETLGRWVDAEDEAAALSSRMRKELQPRAAEDAPRLLWVIDLGEAQDAVTWFIRPDSIHGQILSSVGYRNAVRAPVPMPPRLSPEQLVELAPDGFVAVTTKKDKARLEARLAAHLKRFAPLSDRPVWVIAHEPTMTLGPHVLELRNQLQATLPSPRPGAGD